MVVRSARSGNQQAIAEVHVRAWQAAIAARFQALEYRRSVCLLVDAGLACQTRPMRLLAPVIGSVVVGIGVAILTGGPAPILEVMIATIMVVTVALLAISERDEARTRRALEPAQANSPEDELRT
jgi:ABC-type transport system involved in cytochrome bd biosynthesis fused ATPase/permease subunit